MHCLYLHSNIHALKVNPIIMESPDFLLRRTSLGCEVIHNTMSGHKGKENFLALFKVQVAVCGLSMLNVVVASHALCDRMPVFRLCSTKITI